MRNLAMFISYNGAHYHGYQLQKNGVTVEGMLRQAVGRIFGKGITIYGCSRTDAGVHARNFCINFHTESTIDCDAAVRAMNANLPADIAVKSCRQVPEAFHARFSCRGKRYVYQILNSRVKDPFLVDMAWQCPYPIDEGLADRAARDFIGTHDFTAFCAAGAQVKDKVRTIYDCSVTREGNLVLFSVCGDGFLYNMVRIMAGTLLYVTQGKIPPDGIPAILSSRDRARAGITLPPEGLYLDEVFYDREALG